MHTQRNSGVCMLLLRLHSKGLEPAVAGAQKDTSYLFDSPELILAVKYVWSNILLRLQFFVQKWK